MTNPNDPVFPVDAFAVHKDLPKDQILKLEQSRGLTKRELFAMEFTKALIISAGCDNHSQTAIQLADALIAELSKEKP